MPLNAAYAMADAQNDQSPEFEVFRHLRNAASHGNSFYFKKDEPRRSASWGTLVIDDKLKGRFNPLFGVECIGNNSKKGYRVSLHPCPNDNSTNE